MDRITQKDLEAVVARINAVTNSPMTQYAKIDDKYVGQIGNYHLSYAYGGVSLHRMVNEGGGISDVFRSGHMPKRELYERMHAFISGICAKETT